jgi:hypothetical protein
VVIVVSIIFEEQGAVYDEFKDCVALQGIDRGRMINCLVTRPALLALANRRAASVRELLDMYRSHAPLLHRIATSKAQQHRWAYPDTVMVLERDIAAQHRDT